MRRETERQALADLGEDIFYFSGGFFNAVNSNLTLGAIPRDHWSHPAFVRGQHFGDGLSIGLGAAESWLGRGMMGGGGLMMVTSSGALVPVAAPFAVGGAAMAVHGSVVMSKALLEYKGKDGGNKQSGKNEKHANPDAKNKAQAKIEELKHKYNKTRSTEKGTKNLKKKLQKIKDEIKHWQKKADFKGETHSRTPKGQ